MTHINITCDASNSASQKIIESLGAKFIETVTPPKDYIFYYEDIEPHRIYQLDL